MSLTELKENLRKAQSHKDLAKNLYQSKVQTYNFIKENDTGLHSDYHKKISFSNKEVQVAHRTYQYWVKKVSYLEKMLSNLLNSMYSKNLSHKVQ